ncbi:MAG TPA: MFS transporter [Gaiellaceae bacterium]|nr:MFS transporter [Gaiellaceae bacterium]
MRPSTSLLRVRALFLSIGVAESALVPFLPLVLRERGLSNEAIGAVLALYATTAIAAGPVWGYVADRLLGYERTLVLSLTGTAAAILAFGFSHAVALIAITGSLAWATRSAGMSVVDSIALARLGRERRSAYGGIRLWMSVGFAAGAIVFGALDEVAGLGVVAPAYATLCAFNATALLVVFRRRRVRPARVSADSRTPVPRIPLSALPALALFLVALFLTNAAYNASYTFGSVQIASLGGSVVFVGLAGGLQAFAEVPSMAWTRRLARRLRPGSIFAAGAAIYVFVYLLWAAAATPETLAALRLVSGVGFGFTYVGTVLVADELVPEELRATGQAAAKAVGFGLAPIAGSLGGGFVYGTFGLTPFFLTAAVITTAAALLARWAEVVRPGGVGGMVLVAGARWASALQGRRERR